jgi:CBS domain-containing protein
MNTDFKVIDAMTTRPIQVTPDISVSECAKIMKENDVGSVLVLKDNKLYGILTEYDIIRKAVAEDKDAKQLKVSDIMSTNVHTIEPHVNLFEAIQMMTELDIKHLPVVNNGEFLGFLTGKDILKIEPALFEIVVQEFELREEERKPIFGEFPDDLN